MKVRTFTGSETARVDKQVNDWLAKFGIKPNHTNTAIGQFSVKGEDQLTGKPVNRRVASEAGRGCGVTGRGSSAATRNATAAHENLQRRAPAQGRRHRAWSAQPGRNTAFGCSPTPCWSMAR